MNKRSSQRSEEEGNEVSCDLTKSLEYNFNKNSKAKAAKENPNFKYQNFSEAVNFLKSFENNKINNHINNNNHNHNHNNINNNIINNKAKAENLTTKKNPLEINKQVKPQNTQNNFSSKNEFTKTQIKAKLSNTDAKTQKNQSFKDLEMLEEENLISKLENFEISEYSKTNAHFSREDEQKCYMKFEKNIQIKNNNVLTKSHGNKHFSMANGPYRMDIKPMLGKIKELQEFNFENQFNSKLNLNFDGNHNKNFSSDSNKFYLSSLNNNNNDFNFHKSDNKRKKNFVSVNFEGLRNLNLNDVNDKIENLNSNNDNNINNNNKNFKIIYCNENDDYNEINYENKSVETIDNIHNCMQTKAKYDTEKINYNEYLKNKNAAVAAKSGFFENSKLSEAEFQRNLALLENQNQDLFNSLSLEENSIENYSPQNASINANNINNNYKESALHNALLMPNTKAEFKSVSKTQKDFCNSNNENPNQMRNGGGASTACKTLKTKLDTASASNKNLHTQNKNANLNLKKSTIESKNSYSNISNGLTPINLNRNLENIACSKETSRENILKDKDINFNLIKWEYKNSVSNGKSNVSRDVNNNNTNNEKNNSVENKIPFFNKNENKEIRNNIIVSNVDLHANNFTGDSINDEIDLVSKAKNNNNKKKKTIVNNNIFNNNIINEIPKNYNSSILTDADKKGQEAYAQRIFSKNSHKRISSGLKVISVEKQIIKKTKTFNNNNDSVNKKHSISYNKNNSLSLNQNINLKPKQIIINEENKESCELNQLVNGGGVSNGNFKVFESLQQTEESEPYLFKDFQNKQAEKSQSLKKAEPFLIAASNQNISINSIIIKNEDAEKDFNEQAQNDSPLLEVKEINNISKSQAIPLTNVKQLNKAFNNLNMQQKANHEIKEIKETKDFPSKNFSSSQKKPKGNNEYSETKIIGDDILEDLDEIKDLEVNIKLTKSHKFPRRMLQHHRKKSERKVTVSDIDLSCMRESYYNSRILNLNNSSTFINNNLDASSRKQFFKKFKQNKNSQKNILILDSNLTEHEQSINLLSRSISVISKKNISNFERLDKIKFNKRKNSKHLKTSFLSSFQNPNNVSSQRIKKAFFVGNNIYNLFYADNNNNNNNLEMNSFLTLQQNKSNLNHSNFAFSNHNIQNAFNFKYSNRHNNNYFNQKNSLNAFNNNNNTSNNINNNSVFYDNVNKSLSKIILKNNPNSARKDRWIKNINDLVVFLDDYNNNNNFKSEFNLNLKDNLEKFEKELSQKNVAENLITDKNFDPLISSERDNFFANGEFILFNNSDKSNIKTTKKIKSNNNILIFDNEENNRSETKNNHKNNNNNFYNNDNNLNYEKLNKKENILNNLIINKNVINNKKNNKNICSNNEILEISNFLNYDYNLNPKNKEQNPENSDMDEHEIRLERLSQANYNNIPNFKNFNNNNLSNFNNNKMKSKNKNSSVLKTFEKNNCSSNGIQANCTNRSSISFNNNNYNNNSSNYNQVVNTEEDNIIKEKEYFYKDTFSSAQNYLASELNEFTDASKNFDNFDCNNLPAAFAEKRNTISTHKTNRNSVSNNTNNMNKDLKYKENRIDSNLIVDLEYNLYVKTNFDNSQEDLEKKGKIKVGENLTPNKRFRPDCPSPYESNSNIVISLNNTNCINNNFNENYNYEDDEHEEEKSKSNILLSSAMKKRMNKNPNRNKKRNSKSSYYENEGSSTNMNHIENDYDEIIDLNSLDSASPQDFEKLNAYDYQKNNNSNIILTFNNIIYNKKSKIEESDYDSVNYSSKPITKKEKQKAKQEIEIQVEQEDYKEVQDKAAEADKSSIKANKDEFSAELKTDSKSENNFAFLTPQKPNIDKDSINFPKIRNHNRISTNSLLKNSKIALFYCEGKPKEKDSNDSNEQEQLRLFFENNQATMHNIYDLDFINNLLEKENKYRPDENYFSNHPNLNLEHRAILVDWIMEICEDLAFKRDTLHFAVNYLDRFLSKTENIEKNILQLIGVACLSIAGKFEEIYIPKCEEYISITENRFTKEQLIGLEKYIISTLDWELNPTTLIMWLNWYLCQWDLFIDSVPDMKEKLIYFRNINKSVKSSYSSENQNNKIIFFKKADEKSYIYYRQATQLIDAFLTDCNYLKFPTRNLIASVIFIIICIFHEIPYFISNANQNNFNFDVNFYMELFYNMPEYELIINQVFGEFLNQSFNIGFDDIIPALVYASRYIFFDFSFDLPLIIQLKNEQFENGNYEEFLSFQTHNKKNFDFVMEVNK